MSNGKFRRIYWNGITYISVRGDLVVAVQGCNPKKATCGTILDSSGNVWSKVSRR